MTPTLKDETVILQLEVDILIVCTPKRFKWNEIIVPTEFQIQNPQVPRHLERTVAEQIIEEPDGKVFIKFPSYRERPSTSSNFSWMPARQSSSNSIEFVSSIKNNLAFKFNMPVPEVIHQNQSDYSPTHSQMKREINVINKANCKINYEYL